MNGAELLFGRMRKSRLRNGRGNEANDHRERKPRHGTHSVPSMKVATISPFAHDGKYDGPIAVRTGFVTFDVVHKRSAMLTGRKSGHHDMVRLRVAQAI
ncbi:hypothetical protein JQ633_05690 [Bradyrhizobium tropiciagri]|uniref:hypothetical protein n=1 Tax=Bradyrhizobium tropiciagri TaxID=312253 RepID=UPI001BADD224|nr:hypothetical protein [Bradyrhizobium tropiciagri]MBR0869839.1 hypothetical protein [Bradyrhizobium tropiciagri]